MLTTLPSSGDHSLAHTPKVVRSDPARSTRKPQVEHGALAAIAPGVIGPCEPVYQRWAASVRPWRESTRARPSPSSSTASRSASSSPVAR